MIRERRLAEETRRPEGHFSDPHLVLERLRLRQPGKRGPGGSVLTPGKCELRRVSLPEFYPFPVQTMPRRPRIKGARLSIATFTGY